MSHGGEDHAVERLARELVPRVLGAVVRRFGDFAAAEDAVQEALLASVVEWRDQGAPENPGGWLYRVACRRMIDGLERDDARRQYERALQIDPDAAVAANNLAYIYAERDENLDVARQLAEVARRKLPTTPEVADTLGWIYVKRNMPSLAIPLLEQAARMKPTSPTVAYHLGMAYARNGDAPKARAALQRAASIDAQSESGTRAHAALTDLDAQSHD